VDRRISPTRPRRPSDTGDLYAANAIAVAPDLVTLIEGRDAIVASYEQFVGTAVIARFDILKRHLRYKTPSRMPRTCLRSSS
jgi:hypothetical protein